MKSKLIILPDQKKYLEADFGLGRSTVAGYYKLEAVNARTGRRRLLADWFPNLITNIGLDRIGNQGSALLRCHIGSGTAAPDVTNTALQSVSATTTSVQSTNRSVVTGPPRYVEVTKVFRFGEGVAAGNQSEIGVGWDTGSALFSRALILDGGGSPTTITIQSNEFLDVSYQLRHYVPLTDGTGTVNINGTDYDWVARASEADSVEWVGNSGIASDFSTWQFRDGAIGAITTIPSGTTASVTGTNASYTNGSYSRQHTINASISQANFAGGIRSARFAEGGASAIRTARYQIEFNPPIPKTSSHTFSLTVSRSWGRAAI